MKKSAEEIAEEKLIQDIFSEMYLVNDFLPPERQLAEMMGFSRPVIHKALIRLEGKGLVTIVPRQGVRINDFKVSGKLNLLESIFTMTKWKIDLSVQRAIMTFLRAHLMTVLKEACYIKVQPYKEEEDFTSPDDLFNWMHHYALSTNQFVYTMLFNEFKVGIVNVARFLLESNLKTYQEKRRTIDLVVKSGQVKDVEQAIDAFFEEIVRHWYKEVQNDI